MCRVKQQTSHCVCGVGGALGEEMVPLRRLRRCREVPLLPQFDNGSQKGVVVAGRHCSVSCCVAECVLAKGERMCCCCGPHSRTVLRLLIWLASCLKLMLTGTRGQVLK